MPAVRTQLFGWTPPSSSPPDHRPQRDPSWVPRPRNAFIIFRCEFSRDYAASNSKDSSGSTRHQHSDKTISKRAGEAWRRLSERERRSYKVLADLERQEHAKRNPNYRFRPVKRPKSITSRRTRSHPATANVVAADDQRPQSEGTSSVADVGYFQEPQPPQWALERRFSAPDAYHPQWGMDNRFSTPASISPPQWALERRFSAPDVSHPQWGMDNRFPTPDSTSPPQWALERRFSAPDVSRPQWGMDNRFSTPDSMPPPQWALGRRLSAPDAYRPQGAVERTFSTPVLPGPQWGMDSQTLIPNVSPSQNWGIMEGSFSAPEVIPPQWSMEKTFQDSTTTALPLLEQPPAVRQEMPGMPQIQDDFGIHDGLFDAFYAGNSTL